MKERKRKRKKTKEIKRLIAGFPAISSKKGM